MPRILAPCALLLLASTAVPLCAQTGPGKDDSCPTCKSVPAVATTFVEEFEKLQRETLTEVLRVADTVPEKSYAWKMSKTSPSVLELLKKIADQNYRTARLLRQPAAAPPVTTKKAAQEQVASSFEAVSRGVAAFPPGTDPGKIQVDLRQVQLSMREFMIRHLAASSQLLGELRVWAQIAAERKPAG